MKKIVLLFLINLTFIQISFSQATPDLYLGLTPPGDTPEVFAPGIVSLSGRSERVITFSPSGHEIFFAVGSWPTRSTMYIEYKDNVWSSPVTASFSTTRSAEEPFFSIDGNRVYYYAYPPSSSTNADLYYSEKTDTIWSDPVSLGSSINSSNDEFHPNVVNDGSIYFTDNKGKAFRAQFSGGSFQNKVALPDNVNVGNGVWGDHYVAPDESYLIFLSQKTDGYGGTDLYISFRKADGSWTNPQNFGNTINTSANERSADITPDGKYMTYDKNGDIYWVKIDNTIEALKATSGVTTSVNNIPSGKDIRIFPNPGTGKINISFGTTQYKTGAISITDISGKQLLCNKLYNVPETTIDLTGNPKGLYIIKLNIDGTGINKKIYLE